MKTSSFSIVLLIAAVMLLSSFTLGHKRPKIKGYRISQIVLVDFQGGITYRGKKERINLPDIYVELTRNYGSTVRTETVRDCMPSSRTSFFRRGLPYKVNDLRTPVSLTFRNKDANGAAIGHEVFFSGVELLKQCSAQKKSRSTIVYNAGSVHYELTVEWL